MVTRGHKRAETLIFGHVTNRSVMGITHRCGKGRTCRHHSGRGAGLIVLYNSNTSHLFCYT
jgi:hypothetical protein